MATPLHPVPESQDKSTARVEILGDPTVRKGGKAYFAATLVAQTSALARYVILARLLGEEQLGLAAMLILTAQFFDSISDTGSDRFLVQDADGDTHMMQRVVQLALAARGLLIAIALALFSGLLAGFYNQPDLRWALIAIGLAPLIGGLVNLDMRRVQRESDFRPESLATVVSEIVSLVATSVAAIVTHDYTAVIYGLVLRALAQVAISHLTAKRPYAWGFRASEARRFSIFAAPLFLNGLLLFVGSQGDRVVIGSSLGPAALGHYSAVLLLILYPTSVASRFMTGIHLPQLAASRLSPETLDTARLRLGSHTLILSAGMLVGFTLVAPIAVPFLYGARFAQPLQLIALVAVLQATRFMRFWPNTIAVGSGSSMVVMLSNVARMVGLPAALMAFYQFRTLEGVISGFIFGEFVALSVALMLLKRGRQVEWREFRRVGYILALSTMIVAAAWAVQTGNALAGQLLSLGTLVVSSGILVAERATLLETYAFIRRRMR